MATDEKLYQVRVQLSPMARGDIAPWFGGWSEVIEDFSPRLAAEMFLYCKGPERFADQDLTGRAVEVREVASPSQVTRFIIESGTHTVVQWHHHLDTVREAT